jgi:hypothetical protein
VTFLLGSDGTPYLVRGTGEPAAIGGRVAPFLTHMLSSDTRMRMCSAVFHENHYKLFYPDGTQEFLITNVFDVNNAQLWAHIDQEAQPMVVWSGPHKGVWGDAQVVEDLEGDDGTRYVGTYLVDPTPVSSTILYSLQNALFAKADDTTTVLDIDQDIETIVESKKYRFRNEINRKRIMGLFLDLYYDPAYTHDLLAELFADEEYTQKDISLATGAGVWNGSNWDAATFGGALFKTITVEPGPTNLFGRDFQFKLTHTGGSPIIMAAALIDYILERRAIR